MTAPGRTGLAVSVPPDAAFFLRPLLQIHSQQGARFPALKPALQTCQKPAANIGRETEALAAFAPKRQPYLSQRYLRLWQPQCDP